MFSRAKNILIVKALVVPILAKPFPFRSAPRDGQFDQPACWYSQPGAVCKGAPNIAWCDKAVDQACTEFAAKDPSDTSVVVVVVGDAGSSSSGQNAQCLASVQNSGKGIAPGTDKATCKPELVISLYTSSQRSSKAHSVSRRSYVPNARRLPEPIEQWL